MFYETIIGSLDITKNDTKKIDQLFTKATVKRPRTNFRPPEKFDRPLGSQGRVHTEDAEFNFLFLILFVAFFFSAIKERFALQSFTIEI